MSLIDAARDTLKNLPITDIMRERLSLALDQSAHFESQVEVLRTQNADLKAQLAIITRNHEQAKEELQRLKDEHLEDVRIHKMVEFRKGKRTGGKWIAFCPKCHLPAGGGVTPQNSIIIFCSADCGWQLYSQAALETILGEVS